MLPQSQSQLQPSPADFFLWGSHSKPVPLSRVPLPASIPKILRVLLSRNTSSGLLTLLMGCVIGESKQIRLNPDGSIVCGSIHVDGSAIFN